MTGLQAPLSCHVVMLNSFQHLSFQCINLEIPKQVRNDRESSSIVIASQAPSSRHIVMLNLFQHLSFQHPLFQCINLEILKQVRNDRESSSIVIASPDKSGRGNLSVSPPPRDCFVAITPRNDIGKGSQEGFPSGGGLGVSPSFKKSPPRLGD